MRLSGSAPLARLATVALFVAIALASCDRRSADGYTFQRAEFTRDRILVTIVQHPDRAAFEAAARRRGIADREHLAAFASYPPDRAECTIHVIAIQRSYQPEWLGHEMAHCIHGRWHGDRPS